MTVNALAATTFHPAKDSPKKRPAALLQWEAIVNDPVGALAAVLADSFLHARNHRRETRAAATNLIPTLTDAGVQLVTDLCWCSITEPVFPPTAKTLMTNSGKYAHYAPGLSGRATRFGSLKDCAQAAQMGRASRNIPTWLSSYLDEKERNTYRQIL